MPPTTPLVKRDLFIDQPMSDPDPDLDRSKGGKSCFYFWCEVTQRQDNYGVCLVKLDMVRDRPEEAEQLIPQCFPAICAGTCPALKMREEEVRKGHSLYFYSREDQEAARAEQRAAVSTIKYGRRNGLTMPKFVPTSTDDLRDVAMPIAPPAPIAKKTKKTLDEAADLASRNLIEEGINRGL